MKKVIVVGAAVIDVLLKSKDLHVLKSHQIEGGMAMCEVLGGKIEAEEGVLATGGGGTNVAVGLHRLGEAVKVISRVGDDELSGVLIGQLEGEGVDLTMLQRAKGKTGFSAVLVAQDGGRSIITYRGESGEIEKNEIDWQTLSTADWLQISSLGGKIDLLEDLVAFALNKGIRIGVNPGRKELQERERIIKLLPKVDLFNVNRMEAAELWGAEFDNEKEIMKKFVEAGCRLAVVTDGKRGVSAYERGRWIKMEAFPNKSVDDTGAGDAFASGVVTGLLQGRKIEEVLKMGLANGGSVVTKLGAKAGLLRTKEMEKWMKRRLKTVEESLRVVK
ncbi:MAG TPA: carbohydrate kinase family protein [Candidatus Woesebacteria bacterium]|nr:carbohydrate kinase family protein [Candidatus Woesebacteria bacterium]